MMVSTIYLVLILYVLGIIINGMYQVRFKEVRLIREFLDDDRLTPLEEEYKYCGDEFEIRQERCLSVWKDGEREMSTCLPLSPASYNAKALFPPKVRHTWGTFIIWQARSKYTFHGITAAQVNALCLYTFGQPYKRLDQRFIQ